MPQGYRNIKHCYSEIYQKLKIGQISQNENPSINLTQISLINQEADKKSLVDFLIRRINHLE